MATAEHSSAALIMVSVVRRFMIFSVGQKSQLFAISSALRKTPYPENYAYVAGRLYKKIHHLLVHGRAGMA